ncbi:nephrin, partial [Procambarus clarkii]|uniref:nephrin n=1 Tax=Procambarus clarkii TaxID=6728 RepID=UPI00374393A7
MTTDLGKSEPDEGLNKTNIDLNVAHGSVLAFTDVNTYNEIQHENHHSLREPPTTPPTTPTTPPTTPPTHTHHTTKLHLRALSTPCERRRRKRRTRVTLPEVITWQRGGGGGVKTSLLTSRRTSTSARSYHLSDYLLSASVTLLLTLASTTVAYDLKPTTTVTQVVLAGHTARLPCELPLPSDRPTLILWYKNLATKPFYSFDAREAASGHHKVHEESQLGMRSRFRLQTFPYTFKARLGFLEVEAISLADAGNYTCRVDFMTSQTMMSLLQLTIHEDIKSIKVYDAYETMVGEVAGPYELSSRIMLSCRAYGGYPAPVVEWWSGEQLLESSVTQPASTPTHRSRGRGEAPLTVVSVILHLASLRREDNGREVTCVAANTNLTQPHTQAITIQMYLPPLEVSVEGVEVPLRAGVEASILCRTSGSTPPALLTWNITDSTALTPHPAQSSLDQNTTIRRGRLLPSAHDHGKTLTCTATNPQVADYSLVSSHTINVLFAPEVEAQLAPALDPNNIKEGEDVYFECHVKANPPESRVIWLHQGEPLQTERERGVLAQGRNLVLQKVRRHARGEYQCRVTNVVASVTSHPASLDVLFMPECRGPKNRTVSVTAKDEVKLECVVEANPAPTEFLWQVNSSRGMKEVEPSLYSTRGRTSTLLYRPHDHQYEKDQYGVVFCQGRNRLGTQETPCVFVITPAGPPEEPLSCSLVNQSATTLGVSCVPGNDGGLSQTFLATVRDAGSQVVVAEVASATPSFTVSGLAPGRDYLVLVTATNIKGQSPPYLIPGFALKVAENKINNTGSGESSHLLLVFVGAVSGFVLILTLLAIATRFRCRRRRRIPDVAAANNKPREEVPLKPLSPSSLDEVPQDIISPETQVQVSEPQIPESPGCGRRVQTYVPSPPTHSCT